MLEAPVGPARKVTTVQTVLVMTGSHVLRDPMARRQDSPTSWSAHLVMQVNKNSYMCLYLDYKA